MEKCSNATLGHYIIYVPKKLHDDVWASYDLNGLKYQNGKQYYA